MDIFLDLLGVVKGCVCGCDHIPEGKRVIVPVQVHFALLVSQFKEVVVSPVQRIQHIPGGQERGGHRGGALEAVVDAAAPHAVLFIEV